MREQHQRVVLARRQPLALDTSAPRTAIVRMPTTTRMQVTNSAEVVGDDDAEARRVAVPEQHASRRAAPTQADEAEPADRHPLARRAERLGHHRGDAGRVTHDHRDDGVER